MKIAVTWEMCGFVDIPEANSIEEAIEIIDKYKNIYTKIATYGNFLHEYGTSFHGALSAKMRSNDGSLWCISALNDKLTFTPIDMENSAQTDAMDLRYVDKSKPYSLYLDKYDNVCDAIKFVVENESAILTALQNAVPKYMEKEFDYIQQRVAPNLKAPNLESRYADFFK